MYLEFGLPRPIKNPGYVYGYNGYLPPVTSLTYFDVRFVTSGVLATGIDLQIYRCRFANGEKLILFKHSLFSYILVNNRVIVLLKIGRKIFNYDYNDRLLKIFNFNYNNSKIV